MTSPSKHPLRNLIREIHRRSLWQVLAIYIVGGWVAFEVVQTLTEGLGLPEWFPSFAIVLLIIGLPIVLATAFVQEGVPDSLSADSGSSRTDDHPMDTLAKPSGAHSHRVFTWRNALVGGVGGLALWGVLAAGWILFGGVRGGEVLNATAESASMERSVAVLPFENLSGNPENEYFSDGITEELLNTLAQLPDLRVPGRTSSFAFKGQDLTIQEIADTLHVAHILDGSVRRAGSRVLITAQLVDARTDSHLWSESYERELDDIFAIQREIAQSIAVQLEVRLSGADERALAAGQTGSTEAHDAYLRGRYLWSQRTEETPRNAISEFQRAVELDPEYAQAWSGLADSYLLVDAYAHSIERMDYRTNIERGIEAARRSVSLASELGMAHASLGFGFWCVGDWESSEKELERAIELNPGYATAHHYYGTLLLTTGGTSQGVIHLERALELDPISPVISRNLGVALWTAGRTGEAFEQIRATADLAPGWALASGDLGVRLLEVGGYEEGLKAFVTSVRLCGYDTLALAEVYRAAVSYRATGEAQRIPPLEDINPLFSGPIYASAGETERVLDLVEYLIREGAVGWVAYLRTQMSTDLLENDPRYQALLEEAGITW